MAKHFSRAIISLSGPCHLTKFTKIKSRVLDLQYYHGLLRGHLILIFMKNIQLSSKIIPDSQDQQLNAALPLCHLLSIERS